MTLHPAPEQLALWAGGDLPVALRPQVERHLEACGACREAVQELRASVAWLQASPPDVQEDLLELRQAVMARIRTEGPSVRRALPRVHWAGWALPTLILAAASLILVVAHPFRGNPAPASMKIPVGPAERSWQEPPPAPGRVPGSHPPRALATPPRRPEPSPWLPPASAPVARIELQTPNPNIRVIWLAPARTDGPAGSNGLT